MHVFYASQKGHGKRFAERLVLDLQRVDVAAEAINLKAFDPDRLVEHTKAIFIVATYAGGSAVPGTEGFFSELAEMSRDFRVEKTLLSALQYAVFGCGNSEYPAKDFNAVARRLDRSLRLLGAKRLLARCEGDDIDNALSEQFDAWSPKLLRAVEASLGKGKGGGEGASKRTARRVERLRTQGALDAAKAEAGATKRKEEAERERALRSVTADTRPVAASPADAKPSGCGEPDCCGGGGGGGDCGEGGECCGGGGGGGDCGGGGGGGAAKNAAAVAAVDAFGDEMTVLEESDDDDEFEGGADGGCGSDGGEMVDVEDLGAKLVARPGDGSAGRRGGG